MKMKNTGKVAAILDLKTDTFGTPEADYTAWPLQ